MATRLRAHLITASEVQWSNGEPFDGLVLLQINLPVGYSQVMVEDSQTRVRAPLATPVKVKNGVVDPDTLAWFNSALVPPTSNYTAWWYDSNRRLIAVGTELFQITTDPWPLVPPTLTVPTAASSSATPEETPTGPGQVLLIGGGVPTPEVPSGAIDGANTVFTISRDPSVLLLFLNGIQLIESVGYTRAGTSITMQSGYVPEAGDTLYAILFG